MKLLRSLTRFAFGGAALLAILHTPFVHADEAKAAPASALQFVRASELADKTTASQTLSAEYRPADGKGASVWLVGVAHLGTPAYYAAIQKRLDAQTVVLFEGIGLEDVKRGPGAATQDAGVQAGLAKALGLVFQLDAIDYRRDHFINSDLKVDKPTEEVKERAGDQPEAQSEETLDVLMQAMRGEGAMGGVINGFVKTIGESAEMREMMKTMLVEVLGRAGEFLDLARNSSPELKDLFDVILTERNAVVIADLRKQLEKLKDGESVAIFYGAAHMDEIAKHLRDDLRFVPARQEWDTAFTANPEKAGMNVAQIRMMIEMAKFQLKAMQAMPPVPAPAPK
jgi:hypothetical protein